MQHLTPNQVIRFVGGELARDEYAALQAHLETCAACRAAVEKQRALHATMADWATPPAPDLTHRVLAELAADAPGALRLPWSAVLRVAAMIVLGVGVGYVSGKVAVQAASSGQTGTEPQVADAAPDVELLSEPDAVGLWIAYDELAPADSEDAS